MKVQLQRHSGFTLVELVIGFLIASVMVLCIGFFLADNQRCYSQTYQQAFADANQDEIAIKAHFNKTIRQASSAATAATVDSNGQWLEIYYYSSSAVSEPDNYALFYLSNNNIVLEKGTILPRQQLSSQIICSDVNSVRFDLAGLSAQMFLDFNDGTEIRRINVTAVMRSP